MIHVKFYEGINFRFHSSLQAFVYPCRSKIKLITSMYKTREDFCAPLEKQSSINERIIIQSSILRPFLVHLQMLSQL
jgi:hypothetical protein